MTRLDEVKKLQRIAGILKESDFPSVGETIDVADIDYDMMSYLSRTKRKLLVTLKNGTEIQSTAGPFRMPNNLIFHGKFPEDISNKDYNIQKKAIDTVKIVG